MLLQSIQNGRGTSVPEGLPVIQEHCWAFLDESLTRNGDQYQVMVAGVFGDGGTPTGHGATEVVIHVDFPDGTRAELYYYNAYLENCQEITD